MQPFDDGGQGLKAARLRAAFGPRKLDRTMIASRDLGLA
jgi:hypothetical protein